MNFFTTIFFIFTALLGASFAESSAEERIDTLWVTFKAEHGKDYHPAEDDARKKNFVSTLAEIDEHNAKDSSYKMGPNHMSDWTPAEKKKVLGLSLPARVPTGRSAEISHLLNRAVTSSTCNCDCNACCSATTAKPSTTPVPTTKPSTTPVPTTKPSTTPAPTTKPGIPTSFDIRTKAGCNNAVKNQQQCGDCYVFSALASLECAYALAHNGTAVILSEQQPTSCDPYDNGCGGGWPSNVWYYLMNNGGAVSSATLPFTSGNGVAGTCNVTSATPKVAQVSTYYNICPLGTLCPVPTIQNALMQYGTLSVAIQVINSFYNFAFGIYADPACNVGSVNHAVNIVGWGTSAGTDFWICRNSWGSGWGLGGYFQMKRGVNTCFIENYVMAVVAV
jgi:C1A family cysteine protease